MEVRERFCFAKFCVALTFAHWKLLRIQALRFSFPFCRMLDLPFLKPSTLSLRIRSKIDCIPSKSMEGAEIA